MPAFQCDSIGLGVDVDGIKQLSDGTWEVKTTQASIFGVQTDVEIIGIGKTREEALENWYKEKRSLADSLWA